MKVLEYGIRNFTLWPLTDSVGVRWLDDIHKAVDNSIHHVHLCMGSALLKGGPLELLQHRCDAAGRSVI